MSQLTIYKASAGSGKTFQLTGEYLKILFSSLNNYKRVLAVTFTNKATAEMKNRILNELYKLAEGQNSEYINIIKKDLAINDETIQQQAKKGLSLLLHDYSKFSVSTIDTFFQKIIRSFTHEIGIQPGYSVELDQNEILSQVVDGLLLDLDENKELREWVSALAGDKIEQGKKWDFKEDILNLAREIFKEEFKNFDKQLVKKMSDKDFLKNYIKELKEIKARFENKITNLAKDAIQTIEQSGLTINDFSRKAGGPAGYFYKIVNKSEFEPGKLFTGAIDDITKWYTKASDKKDEIENLLNNNLLSISKSIYNYYTENSINYYSSAEILKHIQTLGILTDISSKLHEYCEEQNIFLISDAAKLLQVIIDNNDTPFIYEKAGSIYKFFMIDEFQDTSETQWHNFKPLIGNSLAQGNKNLVVGDVKQSIYRWRNSDWEILSDKIEQDFAQHNPSVLSLNTNWRSKKNIIDFNNTIFSYSSEILQQHFNNEFESTNESENKYQSKITEAYADVIQNTPEKQNKSGGYIYHQFLDKKANESWESDIIASVIEQIETLQGKNYALKDMAILVRKKGEGQKIANALIDYQNNHKTKYRYDFISNDSLFIANASIIQFTIAILEYLLNNDDQINLAFIAHEFHRYLKAESLNSGDIHQLVKKYPGKKQENHLKRLFPESFINSIDQLKQLPVYELIDQIVNIFELHKIHSELPYLQAFLDVVLDFGKTKTADIHSFITWWQDEGQKKTLSVSENQDAIRIITIHSSKGLEFKNVIIPFCNWSLDHPSRQTNILWCKTDKEPFNQLDLIPIQYSKKNLTNTIFKNDYLDEKFHVFVDNLNLLYVAFTRAEENLFVFSPIDNKPDSFKQVGELLHFTYRNYQNFAESNDSLVEFNHWNEEKNLFEYGELKQSLKEQQQKYDEIKIKAYESYEIKNKLRLKLHDNSFFTGKESGAFEKVNHGKVMHEVFEHIKTEKDIPKAIDKILFEGKISIKEKAEITQKINNIFENKQIKEWFSDSWQVKAEAEILLPNGTTSRPDRVISNKEKTIVIDYKFGEQEEEKHHKQVRSYMKLLEKMENQTVEGYLWFVDLGLIRRVE
ncbi:MAG: UvrD-helicase domain-containing protein [Bacteroidales bacterium]